ncbi:polyprenyl synthetase family protein [Pseudorhodoplanes sp.]|uniref:polyprenyl synthetase family protein n=1 Tax=Pseudorhodoplanes sp. TaxID=1934341 RepID=UPI00391D4E41
MDAVSRIEAALSSALQRADGPPCPPKLLAAMNHAVFPRGARVRPRLCLAVAAACGEDNPIVAETAAASIELLHCASLVHDDLPCFDDADTRRGMPSVHRAFGEPLAVLAGDALIVLAFENFVRLSFTPQRMSALLSVVARAVGAPSGIVAGQAWECEEAVDLAHYHRAKTGSLFAAATCSGAAAAGVDASEWRELGEVLGEAYQVADDLRDAAADADEIGKPTGRDFVLGRPSATRALGIEGAMSRLEALVARANQAIPPCRGAADLRALIMLEAKRLVPKSLARHAA